MKRRSQARGDRIRYTPLKVGFNDIIAQLETGRKKAIDEAQARIERLKEMGKL